MLISYPINMSFNRSAKHFILTLEKGKFFLSKAREVVPKRTYEVIEPINPSIEFVWNLEGIGLGESTEKKGGLETKKCASSHNH